MSRFRSIVVTGGSDGIGRALALHYAAPGRAILIIGRDAGRLAAVAAACMAQGSTCETARLDVRDEAALGAALHAFDSRHPVDLVIANAGIEASLPPGAPVEPLEAAIAQLRINLEGAIGTVSLLAGSMAGRGRGVVLLVSSLAALSPVPDQPAYSASKAGLLAWGEAIAPTLARSGLSVTIACPGFVRTGMAERYRGWRPFELSADDAARRIAAAVEAGRALVAFPWQLVVAVRLGALVPRSVRRWVVAKLFRADVRS